MRHAALLVLGAASIYLMILGLVALTRPSSARGFLNRFAQTKRANAIESIARFIVGLAFLRLFQELPYPRLIVSFGTILAISAALMLALPGAHKRFADHVLPRIGPLMPVIGLVSLAAGLTLAFILPPFQNGLHSPY